MRAYLVALFLMCILTPVVLAQSSVKVSALNKPIPQEARQLAVRGVDLAAHGRSADGIALLKRAISIAPNYIWAHVQYITTRAYYQGRYDEVRAEYDKLVAHEPDNPIYLAVLIEVANIAAPISEVQPWLKKLVELAPDWAWGHRAKASLILIENKVGAAEAAEKELSLSLERDCTYPGTYSVLIYLQEKRLGNVNHAIATAERLVVQPESRSAGVWELWRLRLAKAEKAGRGKADVQDELSKLASSSEDVTVLSGIHSLYLKFLKDAERGRALADRIKQLDPDWYPQRGQILRLAGTNESGISRMFLMSNHQAAILDQIDRISDLSPKEQMPQLQKLLSSKLGAEMKLDIYQRLFQAASRTYDNSAIVKYGEALRRLDPSDTGLLAKIAIALANQKTNLSKAMSYARLAEQATREIREVKAPPNTPPEWFKWVFTDSRWKENYRRQRALALDALGWVHFQSGDLNQAETILRRSVEILPSERNLKHLAENLRGLGRTSEAEKAESDARDAWLAAIKRRFTNQPAADFQLESIDGRKFKLAELKGKVVLLNFWATWCVPCLEEIPQLASLYEKYRAQDFVILAISVDDKGDHYKVAPFVKEHSMNFPVFLDQEGSHAIAGLYEVRGYPTSIFIDRQGNVRYRMGFEADRSRIFDAVTSELLK